MSYFKSPSAIFSLLVLVFLTVRMVFGFSEPPSPPPGANTPAPLNVGSQGQTKTGGLILNTGGASYGLIVDQGSVGIGTQSPAQKLDVIGYVRGATGLCIGGDCRTSWPIGGITSEQDTLSSVVGRGNSTGSGINTGGYSISGAAGQTNSLVFEGFYFKGGSGACGTTSYNFSGGIFTGVSSPPPCPYYDPDGQISTPYLFVRSGGIYAPASDFLFGNPKTDFLDYDTGFKKYITGEVGGDTYVLPQNPSLEEGKYNLQVREIELENTYLDSLALLKIGHARDTTIMTDSGFKKYYVLPDEDIRNLIAPAKIENEGDAEGHVLVYFSSIGSGKLFIEPAIRLQNRRIFVTIEYRGGTGWKHLAEVVARQPNFTKYIVDLPDGLSGPLVLRFSTLDYVDLRGLGIIRAFDPQPAESENLPLVSAVDLSNSKSVANLISARDNNFLRLNTGQRIELTFQDRHVAGEKNSFVVSAQGFYVANDTTRFSDPRGSRMSLMVQWLEERVKKLEEGSGALKEMAYDFLSAKKLASEEIQLRDKITGKLYCLRLENGELVKKQEPCK